MKGTDISDALSVNPLAEFAVRPKPGDVKFVRVRGLQARERVGTWLVHAKTNPENDQWCTIGVGLVHSRDLCTVEDAERQVAARIETNAQNFANNVKVDRIVDSLVKHGVSARRALGGVLVQDAAALGRLLARLP